MTSYFYVEPLRVGNSEITYEDGAAHRVLNCPGPGFHLDPMECHLFNDIPHGPVEHAPAFLSVYRDCKLVGYRTYLLPDGSFTNDDQPINDVEREKFLNRFSSENHFLNEETGLRRVEGDRFNFDPRGREEVEIPEAISLCSFEPSNYGSFLFRVLPKLIMTAQVAPQIPIIAPIFYENTMRLMEIAGVDSGRVIRHDPGKIYNIGKAYVPSCRVPHVLYDAKSLAFFKGIRERRKGASLNGLKLFVSRAQWNSNGRVMTNEAELSSALSRLGFVSVAPHSMGIDEQIDVFSGASVIVGASGSAMFNVVFSKPGTKVINIESEPHWIFAHANMLGSTGMDYGIIEGRAVDKKWEHAHKPFDVDVPSIISSVRYWPKGARPEMRNLLHRAVRWLSK